MTMKWLEVNLSTSKLGNNFFVVVVIVYLTLLSQNLLLWDLLSF